MIRSLALLLAAALAGSSCRDGTMPLPVSVAPPQLSSAQREQLRSRHIFFAHQSVGGNIMDGLKDLAEAGAPLVPERTLRVDAERPGVLAHEWVGENGQPASKLGALDSAVRGPAAEADVIMFKFCYSDFGPGTDPARILNQYVAEIRTLRAHRPGLTIVHMTTPVPEPDSWLRYYFRKARGRMTARERIVMIGQYNDLLRREFGGREPLFDLAVRESRSPEGERSTISAGGREYSALNPAWSEDGEHLNSAGRLYIAGELLAFLADSLPGAMTRAASGQAQ